jgi:hypothetical protein
LVAGLRLHGQDGAIRRRCRLRAGEGAVGELVSDLGDAEIAVTQTAPADTTVFEPRTVALINRGVPGFAVERDGTLHASLMRSCTGWPSGVWIDPPARTAPDGSNFQLQHWSHTFEFALVCGDGDWRAVEMPSRSAEFNHPLLAVVASEHEELALERRARARRGGRAGGRAGHMGMQGMGGGRPRRRPQAGATARGARGFDTCGYDRRHAG